MFYFSQYIFVFYTHFAILPESGPDLAIAETNSDIVMHDSRSKSRPKEMKIKHCLPQILSVLTLSVKCKHYVRAVKNWWKSWKSNSFDSLEKVKIFPLKLSHVKSF